MLVNVLDTAVPLSNDSIPIWLDEKSPRKNLFKTNFRISKQDVFPLNSKTSKLKLLTATKFSMVQLYNILQSKVAPAKKFMSIEFET